MLRTTAAVAALAVAAGVGATACNPVTPYAALVNGQSITQQQLDTELNAIRNSPQYVSLIEQSGTSVRGQGTGTVTAQFAADVLTRDVAYTLVGQELARRHIAVTSSDMTLGRQSLDSQIPAQALAKLPASYQNLLTRRNAQVIALESHLGGPQPSAAAVAAYYQAHKADFEQICAHHILVSSQAQAAALKAQLAAGANFATLAQQNSIDSGSASQGGDLGCVASSEYTTTFGPAVGQVVTTIPLNQVSDPIQSQYGWHLIEVTSRTPETLQQATPAIQAQLSGGGQTAFQNLLNRDLAKAHVAVNPRYGRFVTQAGQAAVVPPTPPAPRSDEAGSAGTATTTPPGGAQAP